MNLSEDFEQIESYLADSIKKDHFSIEDCVNNLDKSYNIRMEEVGEALIAYLRENLDQLSEMEEVGVLSEALIIKLLQEEDDVDDEEEDSDDEVEKKEKERQQTVFRFKIFLKWLSTNSIAPEKKAKAIEMFDFDHFSAKDLASTVRKSGLYSGDKIIERMGQLSDEKQRGLEYMKEQLDDLEQEKKESLSVKDKEMNKLRKEKKSLEEALNRKRKIEEPTKRKKFFKSSRFPF